MIGDGRLAVSSEPQDKGEDENAKGTGESEQTNWDDLVLDESFIRSAEVNEPAARTRMLQERWRHQPPEPQPWRADEPPAGWFFSKSRRKAKEARAARKERKPRRWRRRKGD